MEDKRQIYKEAYKKIDELEKEIDSLKKEKERLEVNTTDELEKLRGRFLLIDGNMKYLLSDLCGRIDVFEIAKNEEDIFSFFSKNFDKTYIPCDRVKYISDEILLSYDKLIKLMELGVSFIRENRSNCLTCSPSTTDFELVSNKDEYLKLFNSELTSQVMDSDKKLFSFVLEDLSNHYIECAGKNFLEKDNIMDDIFDILSTAKIDIKEVDDLKCLKEKIIEYILKNSENPDFTKAYQYSQVNSSKELIKK